MNLLEQSKGLIRKDSAALPCGDKASEALAHI